MSDMLTGALLAYGLLALAGGLKMPNAYEYGLICLGTALVRLLTKTVRGLR